MSSFQEGVGLDIPGFEDVTGQGGGVQDQPLSMFSEHGNVKIP